MLTLVRTPLMMPKKKNDVSGPFPRLFLVGIKKEGTVYL